jgi:PDZ domain-containing protein
MSDHDSRSFGTVSHSTSGVENGEGATGRAVPGGAGRYRVNRLLVVLLVVAVVLVIASRVNLDYYAVQPGTAQSVQQFITVPASKSHAVTHPVLLVDVEISRVSALSYLYFKIHSDTALDSVYSVTGGTPPSQLVAQGYLEMDQAETAAKAAALERLGYDVQPHAAGVLVFAVFDGTAASGLLHVGDVISAVDGRSTPTNSAFLSAMKRYRSGETVSLSVERHGTGAPVRVPVHLRGHTVEIGTRRVTLDLGIELYPNAQVGYTFPFPVSINVADIGGPSAGLAMTLGVIDSLTGGDLTGGRTIAATGTMASDGTVGPVGGVAEKTVAVERAGATMFLVPPQEYASAKSKDVPSLHIYPVSTLDQALAVIAAHGGHAPELPTSTGGPGPVAALSH